MTVTQLLIKLISFKTTTGSTAEVQRAYKWISSLLKPKGYKLKFFTNAGYSSLLVSTKHSSAPDLLVTAHIDVVPTGASQFRAQRRNGKLYGRGTYDMKYGIACFMHSFLKHAKELKKKNIALLITSDEEIGGTHGVKYVLEQGLRPRTVFLPDAGANWHFEEAAKGVWHIQATTTGTSTHGSTPWKGKNAATDLVEFIHALQQAFPNKETDTRTMSVGILQSGEATNKVPDSATANIDFRYLTQKDLTVIQAGLRKQARRFKVRIASIAEGIPHSVKRSHPAIKLFSAIAKKQFNKRTGFALSHGGSDAQHFAAFNIPTILITPKGGGHHTKDEWIDIQDLERFSQVVEKFILQYSE